LSKGKRKPPTTAGRALSMPTNERRETEGDVWSSMVGALLKDGV
jgi:hypothetical protein